MRWLLAANLILVLIALSGCGLALNPNYHQESANIGGGTGGPTVRAQLAEAIPAIGVDFLHDLGITGKGVTIMLLAPLKQVRPGTTVPVGIYLQEIAKAVAPEAQIITCNTGGDWFSVEAPSIADCLMDAISQKPDVVISGAMGWNTLQPNCDDLLNGRLARTNLLIFAGAGDFAAEGLAYPACAQGVTPVVATYDANQSGGLPLLRMCWRESIQADEPACFSNYLSTPLLAAPGALINVHLFEMDIPYCCSTAVSATLLGAGTALLLEAVPHASHAQILQALRQTAITIKRFDQTIGYRASLRRAYLQLKEQGTPPVPQPEPSPGPPATTTVKDFDQNRNCAIDDDEYYDAVGEWIAKKIDDKLFFRIADAWITQTNICTSG